MVPIFFCIDSNLSYDWRFKRIASKYKSQIMVLTPLRSLWEWKSYAHSKLRLSVWFLLTCSTRVVEVD